MIAYYAQGGGLGHLTRAQAVAHTLGFAERALITASPFAGDPRVAAGFRVCRILSELERDVPALRSCVAASLRELRPRALYVDAFCGGLLGELCDLEVPDGTELFHVARRVNLQSYLPLLRGRLPRYRIGYVVDDLPEPQRALLQGICDELRPLALQDPPAAAPIPISELAEGTWLIVHSGADDELLELCTYAQARARAEGCAAARFLLVAPRRPAELPAHIDQIDLYPATPLFASAARIVSAAGWNLMRQTEPFRGKHRVLPLPRHFDDQFARARARRTQTEAAT